MDKHSIVINGGSVRIEIAVEPKLAIQLQELAYSFGNSSSVTSYIQLHAMFLEHCATHNQEAALVVLESLCQTYDIPVTNIHVVVQQHALDEDAAQLVLRAYYSLWNVAAACHCYRNANPTLPPVLFATDSLQLTAMFGGQPGSSSYLAEARWLLDIYRPLLTEYVTHLSAFLESQSHDTRLAPAYKEGLDVVQWLSHPKSTPNSEYLVSAPISMPLTGLVQLMQIAVLYKTLGVSPGDLARYFNVVAGHSQGIATATVFSMLSDEQSLFSLSEKVLGILMLIGVYSQVYQPSYYFANRTARPPAEKIVDSTPPRPMVYVNGADKTKLEALLLDFNSSQPSEDKHVHLAVVNSYNQFVVSGTVRSTVKLVKLLRSHSARPDEDQSKVPFSKRKAVITTSYLNITVPFHCSLLEEVIPLAYEIAQEKQWTLATSDMRLPVCASNDGHDIRDKEDLTRYIIESICVLPVNWPHAISAHKTTHIVDFSVGGFSGFGQLAYKNVEGQGIPVICAGALVAHSSHTHLGTKADLYQNDMDGITSAPNWLEEFGPKLVRTAHDSKMHINTRMQQMLGMPTVMVAGMNPTTGNKEFVAVIANAGYHAELAGGNIYTESDMIKRSTALATLVKPGQGITLNCLYINPKQWEFQYPTLRRMRREGRPFAGLCIGGGVPSFEKALEIISELRTDGFRHVSFKPGNADSIRRVIKIARACGGFPILLQWTGGRAGGHHSFEDFHQPILETYAAIRSCENVALVAGSGFGDVEGTLPYITGDWSQRFECAPMPFDGILLGSRVMVAKEAATSLGAKKLIAATAGLSDAEWDITYERPQDGMATFESEYGELNHMLDTRAVRFVQDIHKTVLSKPRSEQPSILLAHKDEIIARLNSDYMRPWFGKKADGRVADLHDMTYAEVVSRAVELMYVKHQQRWTNITYRRFVVDLIERIESRMCSIVPTTSLATELNKTDPLSFHTRLMEAYPATQTQLIMSEDVQFFLALCKRRGQKPVPFIPVLDVDFGVLLLKDTLWQSEDLDSVVDQDPQRVYIQQGPVAAQYSTKVDEPVKDILDSIYHGHIAALVERLYSGNKSDIPVVEYVEAEPIAVALSDSVSVQMSESERVYKLPSKDIELPKLDAWLQALSGPQQNWLRALLTAPVIVEGTKYVNNYVRTLLRPRSGRTVAVSTSNNSPSLLVVTGPDGVVELELALERKSAVVLTIYHRSLLDTSHQLHLEFTYCPAYPLAPIHADKENADAEKRIFSTRVWAANQSAQASYDDVTSPSMTLKSEELVITEDYIRKFCQNIGDRSWVYATKQDERLQAPMEFLYLSSMKDMTRVLASSLYGSGQLDLVHSYNRIELMDKSPPLFTGDKLNTSFSVTGLYNTVSGKVLTLSSTTYCNGRPVAIIRSTIHGRGYYVENARAFRNVQGERFSIMLFTDADVAVLESKQWFMYREDTAHQVESNMQLEFCLDSQYRYINKDMYSSILTTGTVMARTQAGGYSLIANVDFEWGTADNNPVTEYLEQHLVDTDTNLFEDNGYSLTASVNADILQVTAPSTNLEYAKLSGDGNPIHFNPYLADLGEHPGTICHGLWTSASTRAILECIAADGEPERIRAYQVEFVGGVLPNDTIRTNFAHVGMRDGRMLIKGQTSKTDGEPVMILEAEIDQLQTAYVFTGQGSQEVNMGMELYEQSPAAKSIWSRANSHMFATYGIDLLSIVRTNPTERTVYFNGRIGGQVRSNYLRFLISNLAPDADNYSKSACCLLPGLTEQSTSYTFRSDAGLLYLTQFTQVALVTLAVAAVADMRSKSLIQKDAVIAGHSLGELCALGSLGDIFTIEDLLDIVFCRGMIMQSAIPRDERGRSDFGMAAVNPSRVSAAFDEIRLLEVVGEITSASPGLLEIVNYNVRGHQYVAAGTLTNLAILRVVLDNIASSSTNVDEEISACVGRAVHEVPAVPAGTPQIKGKATTPLGGIDVPFHSRLFADSVAVFREIVRAKLETDEHSLAPLYGRYIPNLTAVPFEVSREYFELVYEITGSPVASEALCDWEDTILAGSDAKSKLATTLLVELLAYQIASPVQWIKTQDHLFNASGVQRVVEIGPSAVLCGMASRTLRTSVFEDMEVSFLHVDRDKDAVYYLYRDKPLPDNVPTTETSKSQDVSTTNPEQANAEASGTADVAASVVKSSLAQPPQDSTPVAETGANSSGPVTDVPLQALEIVQAIVAFKMKKALDDTSAQQNIKALATGKSTLQNEVVGNLQKEFGNRVPDNPELLSLQELAAAIGTSDIVLGTCTLPLIARLFSSKMPGGFSLTRVRDTLQSTYGLGPQRQDALLLVALTMSPTARLTGDADASAWLDRVAKVYALRAGITYPTATNAAKSSGISQGPAISGAEMKRIRHEQHEYIRQQIEVLARYSGIDLRKDARAIEGSQSASSELQNRLNGLFAELGDELAEGIQPCFDALKARRFDSYWNWVRQDAYEWIQELVKAGFPGTADISMKDEHIYRLLNCADAGLLQLLSGTVKILRASSDAPLEPVIQIVEELHKRCKQALDQQPVYRELSKPMYPHTTIAADGSVNYSETLRKDEPSLVEFIDHIRAPDSSGSLPLHYLYNRANTGTPWSYSQTLSSMYYDCMYDIHNNGLSFAGKAALVTGCGAGSIGADIVRGLLMGGAKVVVTSSSYSRRTTLFFEKMYREYGASGSELIVVPFNQASVLDVDNLIGFIYGSPKDAGLGWDLDYVFPFAAVTDIGSMATNLGSHSELALRVMMTNVMRLIGRVKVAKEELNIVGRPAIVMLPLSPNHGITGGDGFYSESKIALMTAFNRWESESWEGYLSVVGLEIGWTRGTGLMSANNIYGELMERAGVRTFSTWEMSFIIFGLLHPRMVNLAYRQPVYANIDGALGRLEALSRHLASERHRIEHESTIRRAMAQDRHADASLMYGQVFSVVQAAQGMTPLAKFRSHMPPVKDYDSLQHLHHLQGMVNLDKVVVITGYGEVSPHGNAETRWEIEAFSELSVEGCIELAWIMGLIRHVNGPLSSTGQHYTGWVDAKGGEPVTDSNIKSRYEEYILAHTGIRLIEPELAGGYNPAKKNVLREVQINQDMEPFEASAEEAAAYKQSNDKHVDIWENSSDGSWSVRFLKGALIRVPMSINADRLVAALVPTGWDAARFGITEDLIRQTDMVTLFTLVAAVEALVRSGITDPYELYQHFHVSEVGNTIGSAAGGLQGWDETFYQRRMHKDVRVDAIQEGMISTIQAWVNMLLMSASGPVKPTVGACATAVLSIDVAVETIQAGKAKVMLAGGVDDFSEISAAEFASMGASSNTAQEFARGRTTSEMCRPCTTTRCGLVESHGSAVAVLMSASAALKCGAPIYGIIGMSNTATDKQGSSVPAPGKGILTSAREIRNSNNIGNSSSLDMLDLDYRRGQLDFQLQMLDAWKQSKLDMLQKSGASADNGDFHANIFNDSSKIERMWLRQRQAMQDVWGNEFWKQDSEISPLRGSLAVWGLSPDDIGLASFHGTSTKANDLNESEVLNAQLAHVGRTPGHVIPVVCQKWMTGHPKGSAAGFMLNGVIQSLRTGIIPGNRNADNIANELWKCDYALYLSKSIQTTGIKSALLKSFGFGQVGGELLVVHPDYILATVDRSTLDEYNRKLQLRITKSDRYWQDVLIGDHPFVQFKTSPPYTVEQQEDVYLNPLARTHYDSKSDKYLF